MTCQNEMTKNILSKSSVLFPFISFPFKSLSKATFSKCIAQRNIYNKKYTTATVTMKTGIFSQNGIMMILSPAKTLDLTPYIKDNYTAIPPPTKPCCDLDKTSIISKAMKKKDKKALEKLLGISSKLADTAHEVQFLGLYRCFGSFFTLIIL